MELEKKKRGQGQNGRDGATEWKSEQEMAMRQQYDC
jgi:hypothetical protein